MQALSLIIHNNLKIQVMRFLFLSTSQICETSKFLFLENFQLKVRKAFMDNKICCEYFLWKFHLHKNLAPNFICTVPHSSKGSHFVFGIDSSTGGIINAVDPHTVEGGGFVVSWLWSHKGCSTIAQDQDHATQLTRTDHFFSIYFIFTNKLT